MGREAAIRLALALAAIAVLAAGIAIGASLRDRTHWGMVYEANGARVILVERDSAAAAAGLRAGATITAIGLLPVGGAPAAVGGLMPVSTRQGAYIGVYWMAQPITGIPWTMALVLITAAGLWLAAAFVLLAGPARPPTWLFAGFALAAALALCCAAAQDPPDHLAQWLLAPALFGALIGYTWLQRSLVQDRRPPVGALTRPDPEGSWQGHDHQWSWQRVDRSATAVAPVSAIRPQSEVGLAITLALSGQAVAVMALLLIVPRLLGAGLGRPLAALAALEVPLMLLAAHLLAARRLDPRAPAPVRRRVQLAALIGMVGWLPALAIGWAPPAAGLLGPGYLPPISPYLGAASLLVIAATYPAIAIRGDLFVLESVMRRAAASLVAGGALLGLALLALHGLDLTLHPSEDQRVALAVALALVLVPAFEPIRRRLQAALERRLAEGEIDYSAALEAIGDELLLALDGQAIAGVLARYAAPLLGITSIQPALREAGGEWQTYANGAHADGGVAPLPIVAGSGDGVPPAVPGDPAPDLLDALLRADQPFAPPAGTAPGGVALCVPVHLGDELRGLLLLGPRRSQDPYRRRERDALVLLSRQVAAALQLADRIAELRARNAELTQLTSRLARAREEERKHLSRELHDAVAQDLVAITRQLRRHQRGDLPEALWQDMIAQAQEALTAIRRICNDLRPAILDMGLTSALRELIDHLPRAPLPPRVHLDLEGAEARLDDEREFALYRVVQEALANVLKHAEASEVTITVRFEPTATAVEIRDDGRGFAVPARLEEIGGDHLGLLGMRERLAGLGGTVCVESAPGQGTRVRAEIPS